MLAASERRNEAGALLVRPEREKWERGGARVHRDRHADTGIRARELLEHENVGEEVRARSAVLLGHADAQKPQLGELRDQLVREAVLAVPVGGIRRDLRLGELARERSDRLLVGTQLEVHRSGL